MADGADPMRRRKPGWFGDWSSTASHHSPWEDAQGIVFSCLLLSFGITLFQQVGLITSGIAGWSLVLHYATGGPTGLYFFLLNAPFYALALWRMGVPFTLKTLASVSVLSVLVSLENQWIGEVAIAPGFAAVLGGVAMGFGLLGVFRHHASVGGITILAVWIEDITGIRAGITLFAFDVLVFASAFLVAPWEMVLWSLLGAVVLNVFLAINHRRDRYIA